MFIEFQLSPQRRPISLFFKVRTKKWAIPVYEAPTQHLQTTGSRLARDFERYATTVAASICLAIIRIMLRRLAAIRAEKFLRDNRA